MASAETTMAATNASVAIGPRSYRAQPIGTVHPDAHAIFVYESVLEEILGYSEGNLQRELGGLLLGSVLDAPRAAIEVRHFLPAVDARSQSAALRFTHETWAKLTRQREERYPEAQVVGWHHTHPGFGIFLSRYDEFIHEHYFTEPWHVAMVVDPKREEFGFFQWRGGKIADCGFVCLYDGEA